MAAGVSLSSWMLLPIAARLPGRGTRLNTVTVIAGAFLGRAFGRRLPGRFRETAMDGFALLTLLIGAQMALDTRLVVQGELFLAAHAISSTLTPAMSAERFATIGVMMLGLGIQLLGLQPIRVANFLPGLIVAPVLVALGEAISR